MYPLTLHECVQKMVLSVQQPTMFPKSVRLSIKLAHDVAYIPALLRLFPNIQVSSLHYRVNSDFLTGPSENTQMAPELS